MPIANSQTDRQLQDSTTLDRLIFFSDAVFAIAITLLVLELRLPADRANSATDDLAGALLGQIPSIMSYIISFLVIALYWFGHTRMFRAVRGYDDGLFWRNMIYLMCIAFVPFPTSVLGTHPGLQVAVVFYAASLAITGMMEFALWRYVSDGHRLVDPGVPAGIIRHYTLRTLTAPSVLLFSILVSFLSPVAAIASWSLIFISQYVLDRHYRGTEIRGTQ